VLPNGYQPDQSPNQTGANGDEATRVAHSFSPVSDRAALNLTEGKGAETAQNLSTRGTAATRQYITAPAILKAGWFCRDGGDRNYNATEQVPYFDGVSAHTVRPMSTLQYFLIKLCTGMLSP
jgi:hypothetical protein